MFWIGIGGLLSPITILLLSKSLITRVSKTGAQYKEINIFCKFRICSPPSQQAHRPTVRVYGFYIVLQLCLYFLMQILI
jgi:hypothetical protein